MPSQFQKRSGIQTLDSQKYLHSGLFEVSDKIVSVKGEIQQEFTNQCVNKLSFFITCDKDLQMYDSPTRKKSLVGLTDNDVKWNKFVICTVKFNILTSYEDTNASTIYKIPNFCDLNWLDTITIESIFYQNQLKFSKNFNGEI